MERHEVVILSEIIEKIYMEKNFDKMRLEILELLSSLVPYNSCSFYLAAEEKDRLLAQPIGIGISKSELQRYIDKYEKKDYTRWIYMSGKSFVYRETDLFTDKNRELEDYYKEIYIPNKMYYSVQMSLAYDNRFLAVISLYRAKVEIDFSDREIFILEQLKNHLENRCFKEFEKQKRKDAILDNLAHIDAYHFVSEYHITPRELEVLGLLFDGLTSKEIYEALSISPHTYKKHCVSIYKKLGINNRWELINFL